MDLEDHDNDDIERELYQLGLTDVPPRPPPALRGAPLPPWPPPHPASARSRSAPSIQEDSLEEPPVLHNPRPPPPHHHHPPGPPPLTHHNPFPTRPGVVGGGRLGLWGGAPHPPVSAVHHSLTDLASDNPGHNYAPARTTAAQAAFNGALAGAAQGTTTGEESVTSAGAEVTFTTAAAAAAAVSMWQQDPGAVHYPGYVRPQDFNTLPRGPRDVSPRQEPGDEDEERLAALVTSVEAALRRIHAGLQESYIMYENPDDEEDPPPPQPVTASLRDPPPSPVPPHEPPGSPPPPAGPQGPMPPAPQGGVGGGAPRLVGPDNASMLSRQLGFIPIQEGAPQPPQGSQPAPRHAERHHHHHHKLSKKVKNHKSKVLLSGLMTCPGPGFKLLNITRDSKSGQGFGFSIKGGREAGIGVYVSRVEQGGPAWRAGLRPGDLLLAANNTNFSSVTHAEAIALLKSAEEVTLTVATTSQLPSSVVVAQTYSWVTPDGRPTSPPPEYNPRLHHHQVSRVEVEVVGSESLGLMIRGGVEYGLGIFITGVDEESAAHKAGLQVGDQILEVNKESFLAVTHDTAVNVLKYSRRLRLALRRVGKVPHSCTTYDRRCWPSQTNGETSAENMEATLAMIEEKSQRMLGRGHHARLKEVVSDYAAGRIPVEHLLITTRDLLNSPDKLSLLTEIREVVRAEDQDKFDAAVFRHGGRPQEKTDAYGEKISTISNLDDYIDIYNSMDIRGDGGEEELMSDHRVTDVAQRINKTPSEDSGVEMSNGALVPRRDVGRALGERKRSGILIRENGSTIEGVTWADDEMNFRINNEEYELRREREERLCIGPKHQKILQKRFSERLLPNREELADHIQPQRRHSHTGEINGGACVKALPKPTHIPSHHAHQQRSTHTHAHARKQYEPYDSPPSRKREEYDLLPTTRVREDYSAPQARLREDYEPPPRGRDEYDPPPSRGRGEYESPSARAREDYDPPARVRDTREDYDPPPPRVREDFDSPVRMRDEYDPPTRPREEYDPPARVREDYEPTARVREDYESPSRVREEYNPPARVREEYDPPARVREEYDPPARVREEFDPATRVREEYDSPGRGREEYDPLLSSGRLREGYELRESYSQPPASQSRDYDPAEDGFDPGGLNNARDEYSPSHAREVFEGSPSRTHLSVEHRPMRASSPGPSPTSPSGRRGSAEVREDAHAPYSCRNRRTSLVVSDSLGRFRVVVKKTRPNLGIAIEGGADTKQKLPRVINIAANGAAFEAGGLRVGQLILAVDGQKLDGHKHEDAARLIAGCWVSRSRPEVEFMVVERKPTAADVRRSSISLLSQM